MQDQGYSKRSASTSSNTGAPWTTSGTPHSYTSSTNPYVVGHDDDRRHFDSAFSILQAQAARLGAATELESTGGFQSNLFLSNFLNEVKNEVNFGRMSWRKATEQTQKVYDYLSQIYEMHSDAVVRASAAKEKISANLLPEKLRDKLYPPKAKVRQEPSDHAVYMWLCRAEKQEKEFSPVYIYLSYARNYLGLDKNDPNLVAAERYMDGYEGNFSDTLMIAQHILKLYRGSWAAEITRKYLIPEAIHDWKYINMIYGKNGASAEDSAFITKWGMLGNFHREQGAPIGGSARITKCECNQY